MCGLRYSVWCSKKPNLLKVFHFWFVVQVLYLLSLLCWFVRLFVEGRVRSQVVLLLAFVLLLWTLVLLVLFVCFVLAFLNLLLLQSLLPLLVLLLLRLVWLVQLIALWLLGLLLAVQSFRLAGRWTARLNGCGGK